MINGKTRRRYQNPIWGGEKITLHILFCDQLQEEALKPPAAARSWTPIEGDDSNELIPACVVMGHEYSPNLLPEPWLTEARIKAPLAMGDQLPRKCT